MRTLVDDRFLRDVVRYLERIADALEEIDDSLMLNHAVLEKVLEDTKWYRR